jgi:hypothetical protein
VVTGDIYEFLLYKKIASRCNIPSVYWFGTEDGFNALVLEYLGPSLEDHFSSSNFKFTVNYVSQIAIQLVS